MLYMETLDPFSLSCRSQTPTEHSSGKERTVETASEDDVPEDLDSTMVAEEVGEEESRSASSSTVQEGTATGTSCAVSPVKPQAAVSEVSLPSHGRAGLGTGQEPDEVGSGCPPNI